MPTSLDLANIEVSSDMDFKALKKYYLMNHQTKSIMVFMEPMAAALETILIFKGLSERMDLN